LVLSAMLLTNDTAPTEHEPTKHTASSATKAIATARPPPDCGASEGEGVWSMGGGIVPS
jgi:hypothetical protein